MSVRLPVGQHLSSQKIMEVFFVRIGIEDVVHTKHFANLVLVLTVQFQSLLSFTLVLDSLFTYDPPVRCPRLIINSRRCSVVRETVNKINESV
jgi:hypothetical protein